MEIVAVPEIKGVIIIPSCTEDAAITVATLVVSHVYVISSVVLLISSGAIVTVVPTMAVMDEKDKVFATNSTTGSYVRFNDNNTKGKSVFVTLLTSLSYAHTCGASIFKLVIAFSVIQPLLASYDFFGIMLLSAN